MICRTIYINNNDISNIYNDDIKHIYNDDMININTGYISNDDT